MISRILERLRLVWRVDGQIIIKVLIVEMRGKRPQDKTEGLRNERKLQEKAHTDMACV